MICKECKKQGLLSTVTGGAGWTTLLGWSPYWDESGRYHAHDPNHHSAEYACSRGHRWSERWLETCPSCDYGKGSRA